MDSLTHSHSFCPVWPLWHFLRMPLEDQAVRLWFSSLVILTVKCYGICICDWFCTNTAVTCRIHSFDPVPTPPWLTPLFAHPHLPALLLRCFFAFAACPIGSCGRQLSSACSSLWSARLMVRTNPFRYPCFPSPSSPCPVVAPLHPAFPSLTILRYTEAIRLTHTYP